MKLTTPRLVEQYEFLLTLRRQRSIDAETYRTEVDKLKAKQATIDRRNAAALAKREEERERQRQREVARKIKEDEEKAKARKQRAVAARKAKRAEKRDIKNVNVLFNQVYDDTGDGFVYNIWKASKTDARLLVINKRNVIRIDKPINYDSKYKKFRLQFFAGSDGGTILEEGDRVVMLSPNDIKGEKLVQRFRDGISHCVFTPILNRLNVSLNSAKASATVQRVKQKIAKIKQLSDEYKSGVPEDKMESIAVASGFKVIMYDILGMKTNEYNTRGKSTIQFTNTRPNHVEEGMIALNCDSTFVSKDTISEAYYKLQQTNDFFMVDGDISNGVPRKLRTLTSVLEVKDDNAEYFERMDNAIGLRRFGLNATKYPQVNDFIKEGRIINSWVTKLSSNKATGHIDMPKAYTQFKKSPCYDGFMGVIHQWRNGSFSLQFIQEHIGIYKFKVVGGVNKLLSKLGLSIGCEYTLPSPEITYFTKLGIGLDIVAGVWGSKMDFEFEPEMLQDRRYCLWSGRLGMERHHKTHSFKCDPSMASHLKVDYGNDMFYWETDKIASIRIANKNVFTYHHILAFITSYTRIQMIDAMLKFDIDNIVKVVLDGIYFVGEKPLGLEWFVDKDIKEHSYDKFIWYDPATKNIESKPMDYSESVCLTGQGGAGKTYSVFNDNGFNRILFVSPNNCLGSKVAKTYNVSYTTIHKLIGIDCVPYHADHAYPPVIFIDELTQIAADWIDKAIELYKDSFIFVAGDILHNGMWFQCRGGTPDNYSTIWKPTLPVVEIKGDRRSLDSELADLKIKLREYMKSIFVNGDEEEIYLIKNWAKKNLNIIAYEDAIKKFNNDIWISGTNKTSENLLSNGVVSGYYKQGGFVEFEEAEGYNKRGSFTCHSFQGQTVEEKKIFISVFDLFEWSMLYTAISRARKISQLVFVCSPRMKNLFRDSTDIKN
jgi:hypothetical protein